MEQAMFGAGCFWGVEDAFMRVGGVESTEVGFSGGAVENPSYEQVCTDETGHAEVVHLTYDPARVSYDRLLEVFWQIHDPTTRDRQGPDIGSQYRSVVFYYTPEQEEKARASLERARQAGRFGGRPVVTQILPAGPFYRAEEYHQKYHAKHGGACRSF